MIDVDCGGTFMNMCISLSFISYTQYAIFARKKKTYLTLHLTRRRCHVCVKVWVFTLFFALLFATAFFSWLISRSYVHSIRSQLLIIQCFFLFIIFDLKIIAFTLLSFNNSKTRKLYTNTLKNCRKKENNSIHTNNIIQTKRGEKKTLVKR